MTTLTATIERRVAAGAAWLDEHRTGWVERINLDTLDLGDPCRCVLGQEWGDYYFAPFEVRGDFGDVATTLGFDRAGDDDFPHREYAVLTEAWRRLIRARREGGAA